MRWIAANDAIGIAISASGEIRIRANKATIGGNTSLDFEAYLQANDVDFRYELETPITTELPELDGIYSFEDGTLEQLGNLNNEITFSVATNFNAKVDAVEILSSLQDEQLALIFRILADNGLVEIP